MNLALISAAFQTLGAAFQTLAVEIVAVFQQILDRLTAIDNAAQVNNHQILARLTALENRETNRDIKTRNGHRFAIDEDAATPFEPLISIETGLPIPNCPQTFAAINRLPARVAAGILEALQLPVPGSLAEKRNSLHGALH